MDRVKFFNRINRFKNIRERFGSAIYEATTEYDNLPYEMGKHALNVLSSCKTQEEFDAAEKMLIAVSGYGLDTLLERVKISPVQ